MLELGLLELGPLKRSGKQNYQDIEIARTTAGVVWEDMPFLLLT